MGEKASDHGGGDAPRSRQPAQRSAYLQTQAVTDEAAVRTRFSHSALVDPRVEGGGARMLKEPAWRKLLDAQVVVVDRKHSTNQDPRSAEADRRL